MVLIARSRSAARTLPSAKAPHMQDRHGPTGVETDFIAEPRGHRFRPCRELRSGPFEAMVAVAHLARRQGREQSVVLAVRRRDHDVARAGELEDHALHGGEPRPVQMLDHFDQSRRIEAVQTIVAIQQRALHRAWIRLRCRSGIRSSRSFAEAISSERWLTSMPTMRSKPRSASKRRKQLALAAARDRAPISASSSFSVSAT